jgi:hypothetical protein
MIQSLANDPAEVFYAWVQAGELGQSIESGTRKVAA